MARVVARKPVVPAPETVSKPAKGDKLSVLEKRLQDSRSAFDIWETAQNRTDQQLYAAIGGLAEFASAVGNDHETLSAFAAGKGMRATKASTPYTVVARLVVTGDRKKASKYATVLQLAARRGIEPGAESVAGFIATEGGIEACLRSFRALPRDGGGAKRGGRPSAFSKAAGRMTGLARINAPDGLQLDALSEDYFIVVGVRDADGAVHLLREPLTDTQLVRKAVAAMAPKT